MILRKATVADLPAISAVERECFPPKEAASEEAFRTRLTFYADRFWLLFDDGKLVSFVDGFCTDAPDLMDEMYENANMHQPNGAWQMIFGVNTIPSYRCRGLAETVLCAVIAECRAEGRRGLVLTCKPEKIHYYAKFGFVDEGRSVSVHGDVAWYQMRLTF